MKSSLTRHRRPAGFSLVEAMVSMTIASLVLTGVIGTFLFGLRTMYKDSERLATNASLRYFIAQVSKETLDATEFYVFPDYKSLDGDVNLIDDVAALETDAFGTYLAYGDCLVLVTRVSINANANVRQVRIYYRETTDPDTTAAVRYYETADFGAGGTATALNDLLDAINLKTNPKLTGSRVIVERARGRLKATADTYVCHPIFSTESATTTPTNDSVSINVEVINGKSVNNLLSSSSFNYTISPRK